MKPFRNDDEYTHHVETIEPGDDAARRGECGAITDWYPYPFMNVTKLGDSGALSNTALVLLIALVMAAILKALDGRPPTVNR